MLVGLYPPSLHRSGLGPAISDLLSTAAGAGVQTNVTIAPGLKLTPETEALLFRAAREAVQNAVKHAGATGIDVAVASDGHAAVLTIRDDGHGFDSATALREPAEGHIGLRLIDDLAAEAGGRMEVTSAAGSGTMVRVEVPAE
jgi:signal transduction histidine kinase